MHFIDIYRGDDLLVSVKPDDNSVQYKKIMGENELRLQFTINSYADFRVNDSATVFGERYLLFTPPIVNKTGQYRFEYNMLLKSEGFELTRAQYLFLGSDNSLKESDFSLMGTAEDFLDLVIANANRVSSGWEKGQVIIAGYRNMTFSMENCYNALGRIAQEFDTEFFIEGKKVHITKRLRNTPYSFRLGKGKGLYEIKRTAVDNSNVVTRLYAFGAAKNLPADYRQPTADDLTNGVAAAPSQRLLMPKGIYFIDQNTAKYGVIEYTQIFEDIYPTRTGSITSVNAENIYKFIDANLNFDVNAQKLPGVVAKITFNTGNLVGYTFDIATYNNTSKEFTINKNKDEQVLEIPSIDLKPKIGDKYVLTDIILPQTYIDTAEAALQKAAQDFLAVNSEPLLTYAVILNPVYIQDNDISINIGDVVFLKDIELNISRPIRIASLNRNIINEFQISIELSDIVTLGTFDRVVSNIQTNSRDITEIGRQLQNTFNGRYVGDLSIEQGTIMAKDMPTALPGAGFSDLLIENATGKIFRRI